MSMELGAATAGIGLSVCPSMPCDADTGRCFTGGWGGIMMNQKAQRWANEATSYLGSYTQTWKELLKKTPPVFISRFSMKGSRRANPDRAPGPEKIVSAAILSRSWRSSWDWIPKP